MGIRIFLLALLILGGTILVAVSVLTTASAPSPQQQAAPPPPPPPVRMVVVAATALTTGTLITQNNLTLSPLPDDTVADQLFVRMQNNPADPNAQSDHKVFDEIVGAVTRRHFNQGEPIQRTGVVKPGDSGFLSAVLDPGMRAITIGVTAISGTAGLIFPGDRVDLILTQVFTGNEARPGRHSVAETIGEDLRVLAIDQQLQAKASPTGEGKLAQTVTLEVTPEQVQAVVVAAKLGDLSLTIRSLQPNQDSTGAHIPTPAVWSDQVSAALKEVSSAPKASVAPNATDTAPPLVIMRADKTEIVTPH